MTNTHSAPELPFPCVALLPGGDLGPAAPPSTAVATSVGGDGPRSPPSLRPPPASPPPFSPHHNTAGRLWSPPAGYADRSLSRPRVCWRRSWPSRRAMLPLVIVAPPPPSTLDLDLDLDLDPGGSGGPVRPSPTSIGGRDPPSARLAPPRPPLLLLALLPLPCLEVLPPSPPGLGGRHRRRLCCPLSGAAMGWPRLPSGLDLLGGVGPVAPNPLSAPASPLPPPTLALGWGCLWLPRAPPPPTS
jgi:hypothetical protein